MASNNLVALDVGEKRVGVAVARHGIKVARPLTTLQRDKEDFWQQLQTVLDAEQPEQLIIGLPRGLDGQETAQTAAVRRFADEAVSYTTLPIIWQDEALTSVKAKETLHLRGSSYQKGEVDALAASYILADYMEEQPVAS